jgi:hypothetical protein
MIFAPIDPVASRGYLKRRVFESWCLLVGLFLALVLLFSWISSLLFSSFLPMLGGNVLAGLIAGYAYLVWSKHPPRLRCRNCRGIVLGNTPWVCGECGHRNLAVNQFPFVHECEQCHLPPKAYQCHHCDQLMFLSEDEDKHRFAYRIADRQTPSTGEHARKLKAWQEKKEEKEAERSVAEIEAELAGFRRQIQANRKQGKTPAEVLQERLDETMKWEDAELEVLAAIERKYKGNRTAILRRKAAFARLKQRDFSDSI